MYIRPLAYKADEDHRREAAWPDTMRSAIVAVPFDRYVANDTNAHVTISSWRRVDDNMIPARGKISGAYANSAFIKTDAVRAGFDEALVLTQEGHVSEGSAENVFMVRDGVLDHAADHRKYPGRHHPPHGDRAGAQELGMPVRERPIDRTEVYLCDELFMSGTAAQITAVNQDRLSQDRLERWVR